MIADADTSEESALKDHRSLIIAKAREILKQFDIPTPDWCATPQPNDPAISRASREPAQEAVPAPARSATSR